MINNIYIRKVKNEDMEDVFNLSNQDYVRKYSINKEKIKWNAHVQWFNNYIHNANSIFYVVTDNSERFLGQIRYDIDDDKAIVSISLSNLIIGKGFSKLLLLDSINQLLYEKKEVIEIIAYVSEDNFASVKLFEAAGFTLLDNKNGLIKYKKGVNNEYLWI